MPIRWFTDSPHEGPDCLCSWCGQPIIDPLDLAADDTAEIPDAPDEAPAVRLWDPDSVPIIEARFHPKCYSAAVAAGEVTVASR
jgi:hypothetical protein